MRKTLTLIGVAVLMLTACGDSSDEGSTTTTTTAAPTENTTTTAGTATTATPAPTSSNRVITEAELSQLEGSINNAQSLLDEADKLAAE